MKKFALPVMILYFTVMPVVGTQAQSPSSYKDIALQIIDRAYNTGDIAPIMQYFAPEYRQHPGERDTMSAIGAIIALRAAMPDMQATIELTIAEASLVMVRFRLRGVFVNEMVFPDAIPVRPTGQPMELLTHSLFRFNDRGLIAEEWSAFDNLQFFSQIGALPVPSTRPTDAVPAPPVLTGQETRNKAIVQQYYDALNQMNFATIDVLFRQDFVGQTPLSTIDRPALSNDLQALKSALPDLRWTVNSTLAEGNWIAVSTTMQGTFTGDYYLEDQVIPPTNQAIDLLVLTFFRIDEQGLVADSWELYDSLAFLAQLGLALQTPTPAP